MIENTSTVISTAFRRFQVAILLKILFIAMCFQDSIQQLCSLYVANQ
jgi:hypothetical protein